jgi:hypothetical protein
MLRKIERLSRIGVITPLLIVTPIAFGKQTSSPGRSNASKPVFNSILGLNLLIPDGWQFTNIIPEPENSKSPFKRRDVWVYLPDKNPRKLGPLEISSIPSLIDFSVTKFFDIHESHLNHQKLALGIFGIKHISPTTKLIGVFESYTFGPFFDEHIKMWYYQHLLIERSTSTAISISACMHDDRWQKYWPIIKPFIQSNEKLIAE